MTTLITLSNLIWKHRTTFTIEAQEKWDTNLLLDEWLKEKLEPDTIISPRKPGWYWISANTSYKELLNLNPADCRKKGCKIEELARCNMNLFTEKLLCKKEDDGMRVVYNGHKDKALSRLREHFVLNNDTTGALGFNAYPELANKSWTISYFSSRHLDKLPKEYQTAVGNLIDSSSGRGAIETAWRASKGWPILCKA